MKAVISTGSSTIISADGNTAGGMPITPWAFNGVSWDRQRTPTIFKSGVFTASGNTALWTPAAGKKFRLMRYKVLFPGSAVFATTAGTVTMTFQDAAVATNITTETVQVPAAVVTGILKRVWCGK